MPPSLQKSVWESIPEGDLSVRYGLSGIKGLGKTAVEALVEIRKEHKLVSPWDVARYCGTAVTQRDLVALAKAGVFGGYSPNREGLVKHIEANLKSFRKAAKKWGQGKQQSFLSLLSDNDRSSLEANDVPKKDFPDSVSVELDRLYELEVFGFSFLPHPAAFLGDMSWVDPRQEVIAGEIVSIHPITTKKGAAMAFLSLSTPIKIEECVVFPRLWAKEQSILTLGRLIGIFGRRDKGFIANSFFDPVEVLSEKHIKGIEVYSPLPSIEFPFSETSLSSVFIGGIQISLPVDIFALVQSLRTTGAQFNLVYRPLEKK